VSLADAPRLGCSGHELPSAVGILWVSEVPWAFRSGRGAKKGLATNRLCVRVRRSSAWWVLRGRPEAAPHAKVVG